jgi:3-hydroxyacyl-[acyl-carrier-protein] dehydratase
MTQIDPSSIAITKLVPHRPPILMVDQVLDYQVVRGRTSYVVRAGNPFVNREGVLDPAAYIEVAAQAFAACNGYEVVTGKHARNKGMIVGIQKLEVYESASLGETLHTETAKINEVGNFAVMEGTILRGDTILARVQMKVWSSESLPEQL